MKKYFLFLLLPAILYCQLKTVESKVTEATVFKDRAMITRTAHVNLLIGENQFLLTDLTTDIKDETVRISASGSGEIKILDVKVERKFTPEIRKEDIKELQKQIDDLKSEMQVATDQIAIYDSKKGFIESLKAESVKYANQKILLSTNSSKDWNDLLKFIETNLNEIYSGIRIQSQKRSEIDQKIKALQLTINNSQGVEPKNYKEIQIKVEAEKSAKADLNVSYVVNSASWYPIYDARVDTKSEEAEITLFGMVQQSTGEDWNDIKLTFSTADPLSIKTLPKLNPWFLDLNPQYYNSNSNNIHRDALDEIQITAAGYTASYEKARGLQDGSGVITGFITDKETGQPLVGANAILQGTALGSATDVNGKYYISNIPARNYNLKISYIGYNDVTLNIGVKDKNITNLNIPLSPADITVSEVVVTGTRPPFEQSNTNSMRIISLDKDNLPVYSNVKSKDISTTFELKTKNSIPSDNSTHKITIAVNVLPIEFSFTSIPKIIPKVYVKGKVTNTTNYPLLEGGINVFVDNDFVNKTFLNTIVPTDTLELALGIDENIKCEKILKNRFVESKGLFSGSKKVNYDYEIKLVNNHKTEETVTVYDQLPVVRNEKIKTELITPEENEVEINADKELVWKLNLKPGETKIIPLQFYVEFPQEITVYGLE